MQEIPFNFDPETLAALERLASERGRTVEELVWEAIDQYILHEKGMNKGRRPNYYDPMTSNH
jgi:predicted DNA-binding protein